MPLSMIDRLRRGRRTTVRDPGRPASSSRRPFIAGVVSLLMGIGALALPPEWARNRVTWEELLAPYSRGEALPSGFRIDDIRRGPGNDVIIALHRPGEEAGVEVHVLGRGRWPGVRESRSFTIGYETPRSPAPERDTLTEAIAETIRARDRGLPSPDAIPLTLSDPGALPWWLEMLRGVRGQLLGLSSILLATIAVAGSRRLALGGTALAAADLFVSATGVPPGQRDLGAHWMIPAATVLLIAALHRSRVSRPDRLLALALFALSLTLRLVLGAWGPLHVNGMGALWVTGAARDAAEIATYGPGYVEIFAAIGALAPSSPDWAIFALNALLSALLPVAAWALARLVGLARPVALAAALLLAIDPVAIRMAATESYFPAIILLCAVASGALVAATRRLDAGDVGRSLACVVGAGLLLAQATRIHPCAWGAVAAVPFVVLAGAAASLRQRFLVFLFCAAVTGGLVVALGGGELLDVLGRVRSGTLMTPFAPPTLLPLAWVAVLAAAYAWLAPRPWLSVAAAVCVAALIVSRHLYDQSSIWQQSYERLYLTVPVVAAIGAVPDSLLRRRWMALAAALAVGLAWFRFGLPIVVERTTDHREYRWSRAHLASLPPECRVIHLASAGKRGLYLPTYAGDPARIAVAMDPRQPFTFERALSPAACLYYVHTSLCSSAEGRPACEAIERRLELVPIARASFPARPSHQGFPYDSDPVETVLYRVEKP